MSEANDDQIPLEETPAATADSPAPQRSYPAASLVLISFLGLFYELAFIRWFPANVLSLSYYANIVLMSCFLGFGLGCLQGKRRDIFFLLPWLVLLVVGMGAAFRYLGVQITTGQSEWIWSGYTKNADMRPPIQIGMLPALIAVFVVNAVVFVPIGQKMAALMEEFRPIRAYCLNIFGSILGIAVFAAFSFLGGMLNSPVGWFGCASILTLWFARGNRRALVLYAVPLCLACLIIGWNSRGEIWSPYYSIRTTQRENGALAVYVNRFFHQEAVDLENNEVARSKYGLPYGFRIPKHLLILGAGTGNDVAIALANGATDVDAVELDATIAELGREHHPNKPYDNPAVNLVVDDARSFLQRTTKTYDMVVFGTLDSHALLSGASTVRLDNFVYTMECLRDARERLTPDGILVLLFSVPEPWLGARLLEMCVRTFPENKPLVYLGDDVLFNMMVLAGPGLPAAAAGYKGDRSVFNWVSSDPTVTNLPTDDWPYLYLKERTIPRHYMIAVLVLVVICTVPVVLFSPGPKRRIELSFFSLGCGFMLLETKSVTTLSLLFGSTWLVNAFVFGAVLTMILLANLVVLRWPIRRLEVVFLLLIVSLAVNYALPPSAFLSLGFWSRSILSSLLVALPIFFAGIVFASLFKRTRQISFVYGSNLLGTVLGGFCEYASMAIGLNSLYLIAGFFYLIALVTYLRGRN